MSITSNLKIKRKTKKDKIDSDIKENIQEIIKYDTDIEKGN